MTDAAIDLARDGNIAVLTLNRPDKRNALTLDMWRRMMAALDEAASESDIKVLIVTGAGLSFAAGADIEEMKAVFDNPAVARDIALATYDAQKALHRFPKPTIAMIRGACIGGGCGIALCCDLRFADDSAKLGITPGKLGLVYSLADTARLVDAVGPAFAKDLLYTGRIVDAEEARAMGLINRLVSADDLETETRSYAGLVTQASQHSAQATKKIVQMVLDGIEDDTPETRALFTDAFSGEDFKEGFAAFMEKRPPKFTA